MALSIPLKITNLFVGREHENSAHSEQPDTFFYANAGQFGRVELARGGVGVLLDSTQLQLLENLEDTKGKYDHQELPDGRHLITPKPKNKI